MNKYEKKIKEQQTTKTCGWPRLVVGVWEEAEIIFLMASLDFIAESKDGVADLIVR